MPAATFTKLTASPEMVRYLVVSTDGTLGTLSASTLISDAAAGPLKALVTQLNSAGSWGVVGNAPNLTAANPLNNTKISMTLTPYTVNGSIGASASLQVYNTGSANVIGVLGGVRDDSTVLANYTSAILEIRYNHSIAR